MDATEVGVRLVAGAALLFANGFFVTTEFAMTRVRQFDATDFEGHGGLERAWEMTERLEIYLSGCQVGITVASVGLGFVAEPAVAALVSPLTAGLGAGMSGHAVVSVALSLAVINLLHVVVGEQAPTYLGVERTRYVARHGAPVLYWWTKATSPVIVVADWTAKRLLGLFGVEIARSWAESEEELSRADLRSEIGTALSRGQLTDERREEVLNALEIGTTPVSDVMVPRESVVALSTTASADEVLDTVVAHPHVRYPLVGGSLEEFVGIVYVPRLTANLDALREGETTLSDLAAPPMAVSADTSVSDLIDEFQMERQELALVLEDGEVVGMVTQTDAVEAVTGELEDPLDR